MARSKKLTPIKPKIYYLSDSKQEVHYPGDNSMVAVCWNTQLVTKTIKSPRGRKQHQVEERMPNAIPYICFMSVWEDLDGKFHRTEESPVDGGMGLGMASDVVKELTVAIEYFKTLGKNK